MKDTTKVNVKKLEWYNHNLKVDFKKLFISLSKSVLMFTTSGAASGTKEFIDIFNAFEKKSDAGNLAYRLLLKAMVNAAHNLAEENKDKFKEEFKNNEQLYYSDDYVKFLDSLNEFLEPKEKEIKIGEENFKNPRSIPFLQDFATSFKSWLHYFGLEEVYAQNIANRLPAYFVMALNDEWRSNVTEYSNILNKLNTPFTKAATRELEWKYYNDFLQKQINEPVFGESFGLSQIYVPLRAYYKQATENKGAKDDEEKNFKQVACYLENDLNNWLNNTDKKQAVKFISGGPGSGKSSFAKIWSAKVAEEGSIRVLFIPLHLFDLQGDIVESVGKFVKEYAAIGFSFNPLVSEGGTEKILIVFDGLDELSQRGKYAAEVAQSFILALDFLSNRINYTKNVALFLITGRELAIQTNTNQLRLPELTYHLLPYHIKNIEKEKFENEKILKEDQRNIWWQKFGAVKDKSFEGLPEELKLDRLDEITAQPLLNYLVALSVERGKIEFTGETNLNDIYKDLIEGVYDRAYDEGRTFKPIEELNKDEFKRILEEIAISAWHGGDTRTTSLKKIEEHIDRNNLRPLMAKFEKEAEKGILRLLTAFYFREHGVKDGDKTFEFTHKSFGEYLTATRLVKQLHRISDELEAKVQDYDRGWSENEALGKWLEMTGETPIDLYLFNYIQDEIYGYSKENVAIFQKNIAKLLSYMLSNGMPMLSPRSTHKQESSFARNSSEALLVLHSACARYTNIVSDLSLSDTTAFGAWFSTLLPQRSGNVNPMGFSCLNHLNLSNYIFRNTDLYEANLSFSNLSGANLRGADLRDAYLREANLRGAYLREADLHEANLSGADLRGADLYEANLRGAYLDEANLKRAHLEDANLREADLRGAYLYEANLREAYLEGADLSRADLIGADLSYIDPIDLKFIVQILVTSRNLRDVKGLSPGIINELKRIKPKLFE